jgi:multiple RNA-binding domain-containing protein 1
MLIVLLSWNHFCLQVHILLDHARNPKGLGYVSFSRPADALEAYRKLDQHDFQGRLLHILPAVTRNSRTDSSTTASKGKNSVKLEQDAKRKLESSKQFNWATLYMNVSFFWTSLSRAFLTCQAHFFFVFWV